MRPESATVVDEQHLRPVERVRVEQGLEHLRLRERRADAGVELDVQRVAGLDPERVRETAGEEHPAARDRDDEVRPEAAEVDDGREFAVRLAEALPGEDLALRLCHAKYATRHGDGDRRGSGLVQQDHRPDRRLAVPPRARERDHPGLLHPAHQADAHRSPRHHRRGVQLVRGRPAARLGPVGASPREARRHVRAQAHAAHRDGAHRGIQLVARLRRRLHDPSSSPGRSRGSTPSGCRSRSRSSSTGAAGRASGPRRRVARPARSSSRSRSVRSPARSSRRGSSAGPAGTSCSR